MAQRSSSVQERIIEAVRKSIYSGDIGPGEPLLEMHLARQHGVSQTTVREALVKLEHTGLVRRIRNQGTFVTELSISELREHLRLRIVLECMAAVDAASRMDEADFEQLQVRFDRIVKAVTTKNTYYEIGRVDLEFHRFIWECSGNKTICRILDQLATPMLAYVSIRSSSGREEMSHVVREHQPILDAMRSGVPEAIQEAIRLHFETSYRHAGVEAMSFARG